MTLCLSNYGDKCCKLYVLMFGLWLFSRFTPPLRLVNVPKLFKRISADAVVSTEHICDVLILHHCKLIENTILSSGIELVLLLFIMCLCSSNLLGFIVILLFLSSSYAQVTC